MSKRILLTGATGYLGSHLAEALLDKGHSIIGLKRKSSSLRRVESILPMIAFHDVEDLDLSVLFEKHGAIDAVIHTATCYGRGKESVTQIFEANTAFPVKLMEAAMAAGVSTFLNTDTVLDKNINAYSLSKNQFAEWGKYLTRGGKMRFVNIRLEHFYGPCDDDSKFTTHVIKSCLANVPELRLTLGEQKRDFIYIDDVVSAYQALLEKRYQFPELFTQIDVGSGNAFPIRQFVEMVHRITASKTRLAFGALPYREGEAMFSQAYIEPLRLLGWDCKHTLEQGVKAIVEGYKR
jgi:nucleoside-diphosphate-sugar epimerase